MKLDEFVNTFDLHDSVVENLYYLQEEAKLIVKIALCNWRQSSYQDTESELLSMLMIFEDVKKVQFEPVSIAIQHDEILDFSLVKNEVEQEDTIRMVLRGDNEINIIGITAQDVILRKV